MDIIEFAKKQAESKPYHDNYDLILTSLDKTSTTYDWIKSNNVDIAYLIAKGYIVTSKYSH